MYFMITLKKIVPVMISLFLMGTASFAQKGKGHGHGHGHKHPHAHKKVVVVKRSPFRPAKVVVYRPVWGPKHTIHRRWVFFPKYNLYWDNWRNHYVFWNGAVWINQPTPPPVVVNINLENEKHVTLKEDEDDVDDVYKVNEDHKKEYKPE
jgi:hypothetical protein